MSETLDNQKAHILKLLKEKSVMKQDVFKNTIAAFELVKKTAIYLITRISSLQECILAVDSRINSPTSKWSV